MEKIIKKFIDFNFFILYAWEQGRDKFRKLWEKNLVGLNLILTFLHFFFLSLFFLSLKLCVKLSINQILSSFS